MWLQFLLALGITASLHTLPEAAASRDPNDLLQLARSKIVSFLEKLPRFMCTETIDRQRFRASRTVRNACDKNHDDRHNQLIDSDRLRLDVGITQEGEIYSWAGEKRFSDRDVTEMIRSGSISNGAFGTFLSAIFLYKSASFAYQGERVVEGRQVAEFTFRIPQEKSHYILAGRSDVVVGYGGTFLVDPRSGDLLRLLVQTDRLPEKTEGCWVTTTLDYVQTRLQDVDFIFPKEVHARILHVDGSISDNRSVFTACHEFTQETKISFGPEEVETPSRKKPEQSISLPVSFFNPGLSFQIALTQDIDTDTAAIGDPIDAKLLTPIADDTSVLAPQGSLVHARITQFQLENTASKSLTMAIRLETVEINGVPVPLSAEPDFRRRSAGTRQRNVTLGSLLALGERSASFRFTNVGPNYKVRQGLESDWITSGARDK